MEQQAPDTAVNSPLDILLDGGQFTGHATEQSSGHAKTGLTAIEAARVAGVHPRTIRRAIVSGHLSALKQDGAYQIDPADLAAWQAVHAPKAPQDRGVHSPPDSSMDTQGNSPQDRGPGSGLSTGQAQQSPGQVGAIGEGTAVAELWRLLEQEHLLAIAAKDAQIAQAVADAEAIVVAKDQTIGELSTDVAYLRQHLDQISEQLEQRSRELAAERERADVIQQLALQRIEALTAGLVEQREDAPTAAPEPPGATEAESEGDPSSWWARAFRKVGGG